MGSLNAHFGLGQATIIDQVVIKWPSGAVDTLNNVTPNQMLSIVEGSTLGVNSYTSNAFTLYPNPVKNILNVALTNTTIELKSAEVFDLNGRRVLEANITNHGINVEKLATGTYILVVRDITNKDYTQKFIKE
jgi:hypothetical protein